MRSNPKTPCVGDSCATGAGEENRRRSANPVHVTDRAAQFLGEFPVFGPEQSGVPFLQLTCDSDIKPGTNDVPSEDALVLQLLLPKGQEQLVGALRDQQDEVRGLQQLLSEQQGTLLSQQKDILEQQKRIYEQMDQVKSQYGKLLENMKQLSFQSLQGEVESQLEALRGQVREPLVQAFAGVHKGDMEVSVMEMGGLALACGKCSPEEYCGFSRSGNPRCERCTVCPAGFFLVAQCSIHADRICQDRDECLEITNLCRDTQKCLNTPGGFRCQGMSEREGQLGMCGHAYFYNAEMEECQACSECEGEPVATPCSVTTDTVCSSVASASSVAPDSHLSLSWAGDVGLPPARAHLPGHSFPSMQLQIQGRGDGGGALVAAEDRGLAFRQHGLVWLDENVALSHGCRSFVQVCLRLNVTDGSEQRDLSGVRVEQREGQSLQSASVSAVAEVAPGHVVALSLRSAGHHCNHSADGLRLYDPAAPPLSLLWLSHDTGAVAMTAQAVASAHYHSNYRPSFRVTLTSDPYVAGLSHDGRHVRFAEAGNVRFVFQQALYSMGQPCVSEGFQLVAYLNRNASGAELSRVFKPGVHYRDTSISLSAAAKVGPGDTLGFEILSPAQCNIRYFGDETAISTLSLVWVPSALSSSLSAAVSRSGLPSGAVRNKPLFFRQSSPAVAQVSLLGPAGGPATDQRRDFVFRESGTASLSMDLKLIHSCSLLKVGNATAVHFLLDCVRGRINEISHQTGSGVSILWVAA
ncbi:uncharacterized protein FYW47_016708 [Aplochiton taeniatus]